MDNNQIYFAIGALTTKVEAQGKELHALRTDVKKLVDADTLARGGKKMLYKVGAVCSTLGAGIATAAGYALEHFKP